MYGATVFIGISQSILLNTSVAFIVKFLLMVSTHIPQTEIIEKTNGKYTFIYGSYNLIEKILNGVVIFLIMVKNPSFWFTTMIFFHRKDPGKCTRHRIRQVLLRCHPLCWRSACLDSDTYREDWRINAERKTDWSFKRL